MANLPAVSIRRFLILFFTLAFGISLIWSKALISILPAFILFAVCVDIQVSPFKISWLATPGVIAKSIREKPAFWVFTLLFWIYAVDGLFAGNFHEWWSLTHMKIPFLILPAAFALMPSFSRKEFMIILGALIAMLFWSSIWVQAAYYSEFDLFTKSVGYGSALPSPTNHIRYSILIAISVIICLHFFIEKSRIKFSWEPILYLALALYFFYFIHIFSVRSGIALVYTGLVVYALHYVKRLGIWKIIFISATILVLPYLAYKSFPGFEQKINYMIYDLKMYQKDQTANYSDSERFRSYEAGFDIAKKYPFFGTGSGRFREELKSYYQEHFGLDTYNRPHNQWMTMFVLFGLTGLIIFVFITVFPFKFTWFLNPALGSTLYIMQLTSMTIEHPLDTALGAAMFLFFTMLCMNYQMGIVRPKAET